MTNNLDNSNKYSRLLLDITEDLAKEGLERSFKISNGQIFNNRFLIGINTNDISKEKLLDICRQINMPDNFQIELLKNITGANSILFGFEENATSCIYKVYLEYWDDLKNKILTQPNISEPTVLYLGYNWDTRDNSKAIVTHYTCPPQLTINEIIKKIARIYSNYNDQSAFETIKNIINLAATKLVNDSFVYLEVSEDNNPRKSFDLNLYKANLQLSEIHPLLKNRKSQPPPTEEFEQLLNQTRNNPLGHISGGIDRNGHDFLTIYYEVDTIK